MIENTQIIMLGAVEVLSQNGKGLRFNGDKPTYQLLDSYDHLIKGSNSANESKIVARGGLDETTKAITDVIDNYQHQLALLADHLKADSLEKSTFNIWHFIKKNIRYDFDLAGVEEIRTPARTWKDRFDRSDCEDYAIFASALLINMGYTPTLRIVAFNNKAYFQHIYVVINGITIDAVLNTFNKDPQNITKIMDIKVLSGLGATEQSDKLSEKLMRSQSALIREHRKTKCRNKKKAIFRELRKVRYLLVIKDSEERDQIMPIMASIHDITEDGVFVFKKSDDLESVANYLESVNDMDEKEISGLGAIGFKNKMTDVQLQSLKNQKKELIEIVELDIATKSETQPFIKEIDNLINEGLSGLGSVNGLSGWFSKVKKGLSKAKRYAGARLAAAKRAAATAARHVKNVAIAAAAKAKRAAATAARHAKNVARHAKNIAIAAAAKAKAAAKKTWKFIKKFNPLSVLARNAYLGLLRLNFKGWAADQALGYGSRQQLIAKGFSNEAINDIYKRKSAVEKKWKAFGGNTGSLRKAVLASKKAKRAINGVDGLGVDPVTVSLASAAPIILAISKVVEKFKVAKSAVDKVRGAVDTFKSGIDTAKSFLPGGGKKPISPSPPRPQDQNVVDKDEQNFVNNELANDTRSGGGSKNGSDSGKEKDNTILWVAAASVVGIGIFAMTR